MREFASRRPSMFLAHLLSEFDVQGLSKVSVDASEGGSIRVNRLEVTGAWSGRYWHGIPLALEARPDPGYRFVGWEGSHPSADRVVSLDPAGDINVLARFEPGTQGRSAIVINEIHYHPAGASGDWVELVNAGPAMVDITGWTFEDPTNQFVIPAHAMMPGQMVVLCEDAASFEAVSGTVCLGDWTFRLANGGEQIRLIDGGGIPVDSVAYEDGVPWPSEPDGQGPTLSLRDPLLDNGRPESWRPSRFAGGTPGQPNAVYTDVEAASPELPLEVTVYPNPARDRASALVSLPAASKVTVQLFDALGRWVFTADTPSNVSGRLEVPLPMASLAPGVYLLEVRIEDHPPLHRTLVRIR